MRCMNNEHILYPLFVRYTRDISRDSGGRGIAETYPFVNCEKNLTDRNPQVSMLLSVSLSFDDSSFSAV
jgi:hypothetical protein